MLLLLLLLSLVPLVLLGWLLLLLPTLRLLLPEPLRRPALLLPRMPRLLPMLRLSRLRLGLLPLPPPQQLRHLLHSQLACRALLHAAVVGFRMPGEVGGQREGAALAVAHHLRAVGAAARQLGRGGRSARR